MHRVIGQELTGTEGSRGEKAFHEPKLLGLLIRNFAIHLVICSLQVNVGVQFFNLGSRTELRPICAAVLP